MEIKTLLKKIGIIKKNQYKLMWSSDFKAWQCYLIKGNFSYFKGWAVTQDTRYIKLLGHERRLGGNTHHIYNSMKKISNHGYKISY